VRGESSFHTSKEQHIKEYTYEIDEDQKEFKPSGEGAFLCLLETVLMAILIGNRPGAKR